ncbi:unnamed protein product, partial [Mesorhabditis spiculigera]
LATDKEVRAKISFVVIPQANPDGYDFSFTIEHEWRKNRAKQPSGTCLGVDLNRNYPFHWGEAEKGEADLPCHEVFMDVKPGTQPEVKAVMGVLQTPNVKGYLSLHSFGQLILRPYGYAKGKTVKNEAALKALGDAMRDAIKKRSGANYTSMLSSQLYPAAGASDDYAASLGIPWVYTMELSPSEDDNDVWGNGFQLPETKIVSTAQDVWTAIKLMSAKIVE